MSCSLGSESPALLPSGHQCPTLTACHVLQLQSEETFSGDTVTAYLGKTRAQLGESLPRGAAPSANVCWSAVRKQ